MSEQDEPVPAPDQEPQEELRQEEIDEVAGGAAGLSPAGRVPGKINLNS